MEVNNKTYASNIDVALPCSTHQNNTTDHVHPLKGTWLLLEGHTWERNIISLCCAPYTIQEAVNEPRTLTQLPDTWDLSAIMNSRNVTEPLIEQRINSPPNKTKDPLTQWQERDTYRVRQMVLMLWLISAVSVIKRSNHRWLVCAAHAKQRGTFCMLNHY